MSLGAGALKVSHIKNTSQACADYELTIIISYSTMTVQVGKKDSQFI